ncbi:TM0106 family RecB-like putative nuclease [Arthrobacter sp. zg-Y826]|uniref:TM0106 family RecB-like putative nuclease n=1 Tax=Arthrobacter jinronghuae TaxID=2964609 RepID=UPI0021084BEC|nr:bifunctional RecB family nuclease/DEAD/DEAH box helicase [Arthrobacter jinronghuae]MCQ1956997.1 TM0106 family RecB-like putative nuclease [Arthrobacter jinronghuae]
MFLIDALSPSAPQDLIFSASDLVSAAECEYQVLRKLDERLGLRERANFETDALMAQAAKLGDAHELRVLNQFYEQFGKWNPQTSSGVYEVDVASEVDRSTLEAKHKESIAALRSGANVVFQASFFDGSFHGRSDFLVRDGNEYAVFDTKLARHAKTTALLQLAAYADQLLKAGITPSPTATLILGTGERTSHRVADILPVFRERRNRFIELTAQHRAEGKPATFDDSPFTSCGRCDYCQEEVEQNRDVLLVGGMSTVRRKKLMAAGIHTIDQLAALPDSQAVGPLRKQLRDQAQLQLGLGEKDGSVSYAKNDTEQQLSYRVVDERMLARIPAADPGDIFFDFEGDPLWQDPQSGSWGLEYLFGVVEKSSDAAGNPPFKPFWAHSRSEERQAFTDFLTYVAERRRQYPGMHVYHYANYEKAALRRLSLTHVIGEDMVDQLLRDNVLIDLYDVVRHSLLISEKSYSIKKLEPLYMGTNLRAGDVTDAGASVVAYAQYREALDEGNTSLASGILSSIADYNEYDCLSTLELRDWLLKLAADRGIAPAPAWDRQEAREAEPPSPEEQRLLDHVSRSGDGQMDSADDQAIAMIAAATGYHRREDKQFWWGHFDRLKQPVSEWSGSRDNFIVESVEGVTSWEKPTPRSSLARELTLTGTLAEGSSLSAGTGAKDLFCMYEAPLPEHLRLTDDGANLRSGHFQGTIKEMASDGERIVITLSERLPKGADPFFERPIAVTPGNPIDTRNIRKALKELAESTGKALPGMLQHPGVDLLRRAAPRLCGTATLPAVVDHDYVGAITAAVRALDNSYLAVQGPPGTGKTHVGSHVIKKLVVDYKWKVGVVAQSHAVVDNMLSAAIQKAGLPPELVAKKTGRSDVPWDSRTDPALSKLLASEDGCLIGGTAWTMTGSLVAEGALDLLVIDEAGQFSLANMLAVSRAAKRLLLLGDPQQLPQVSQGTHPEPVDVSALGWLSVGHATLPAEFGYFLADSWRMHPDLCRAVSMLAYDGKLDSTAKAAARHLADLPSGVETVPVLHQGNSTSSVEEAHEVLAQIRRHIGAMWTDGADTPRPLEQTDILVVAAYNAQVNLIRTVLDAAGQTAVRVGTVDKFQGQEAAVVIVSMACSAPAEAPRGMGFLLNRNRINVAVSRGQWRAVIIRSPELTRYMPARPEALEELGAFIGLCGD